MKKTYQVTLVNANGNASIHYIRTTTEKKAIKIAMESVKAVTVIEHS